ncbi:MAG: hypothetical protein ACRC1R_00550 [Cetobacterium sp.]|uniref:hypothetical protein n=1 Tax=Cetobacterium sp. TaxID=2071632 RepID=UPI003F331506
MEKNVLGLKDFLKKAAENEEKRVKVTHIEVEGFGLMEFVRPREGVMLDYLEEVTDAVDIKKEKFYEGDEKNRKVSSEIENSKVKMRSLIEAAEKFVYLCCPTLQASEVREQYKDMTPYEIPTAVFGHKLTIELADKINNVFDGTEAREKIKEAIKN